MENNALVVSNDITPSISLTRKQGKKHAKEINKVRTRILGEIHVLKSNSMTEINIAKAQTYLAMSPKDRKGFCDSVNWKYATVKTYSTFLNDLKEFQKIQLDLDKMKKIYPIWRFIYDQREKYYTQEQRVTLLGKMLDENLSFDNVKDLVAARIKRVDKKLDEEFEKILNEESKVELSEEQEEELQEEYEETTRFHNFRPAIPKDEMTLEDAYSLFELKPLTSRVINTIYKVLAKEYHPDKTKDDGAKMTSLNKAKALIMENLK